MTSENIYNTQIPQEVQLYIDGFIQKMIELEREGYDNKLLPFTHKEEELRLRAQQFFANLHQKLTLGQQILKSQFALQEKEDPKIAQESSFKIWESALESLSEKMHDPNFSFTEIDKQRPLQEQLQIPWSFMNRAYQTANSLLQNKQYVEAENVYILLCFLHPGVFEYWLCSATCKQELGKLEEALNAYAMSLLWEPTNPLVFFQIASCYCQGKEPEKCLRALGICIDYAQKDARYRPLLTEALNLQRTIGAA